MIDDIVFSNAPGEPEAIYGQAFFPFVDPVSVCVDDTTNLEIRADSVHFLEKAPGPGSVAALPCELIWTVEKGLAFILQASSGVVHSAAPFGIA